MITFLQFYVSFLRNKSLVLIIKQLFQSLICCFISFAITLLLLFPLRVHILSIMLCSLAYFTLAYLELLSRRMNICFQTIFLVLPRSHQISDVLGEHCIEFGFRIVQWVDLAFLDTRDHVVYIAVLCFIGTHGVDQI